MKEQIVVLKSKYVYGRPYIYPNCPISVIFCRMLRQTTLTSQNVEHIRMLGYKIKKIIIKEEEIK